MTARAQRQTRPEPLPATFYDRDPRDVAVGLLGKVFQRDEADGSVTAARIVEVEAYLGVDDPGSHAYRGETPRTRTMFGPPGGLYVYFTYGMHWCANAVCRPVGTAGAVLLRAAAPLTGQVTMQARRGPAARRPRDLCSGPAKFGQAFGLDRAFDGADLPTGDKGLRITDDGEAPQAIANTTRIGLTAGAEHSWRWYVEGDENVSRARPARPRSSS